MSCSRNALSRDGVRLHLTEAGEKSANGIIFIHGTGSSHQIWQHQLHSSLLQKFHLVAYDLRGHGESDAPLLDSSYQNGQHWADDLAAVIKATNIKKPVVVVWSYGGRTVCDYLRYYGGSHLSGINFIAAGTLSAPQAVGTSYALLHDLFSSDLAKRQLAEQQFSEALQKPHISKPEISDLLLNDLNKVSLTTRCAMRQRVLDYEAELAKLKLPVLLSHGIHDPIVNPILANLLCAHIKKAKINLYLNSGHIPFWQEPLEFNQHLADFASACQLSFRS